MALQDGCKIIWKFSLAYIYFVRVKKPICKNDCVTQSLLKKKTFFSFQWWKHWQNWTKKIFSSFHINLSPLFSKHFVYSKCKQFYCFISKFYTDWMMSVVQPSIGLDCCFKKRVVTVQKQKKGTIKIMLNQYFQKQKGEISC